MALNRPSWALSSDSKAASRLFKTMTDPLWVAVEAFDLAVFEFNAQPPANLGESPLVGDGSRKRAVPQCDPLVRGRRSLIYRRVVGCPDTYFARDAGPWRQALPSRSGISAPTMRDVTPALHICGGVRPAHCEALDGDRPPGSGLAGHAGRGVRPDPPCS